MRDEEQMMNMIITFAEQDERVRAVILNGSRANPNIEPDQFQDYDVVYYVKELASFISDHSWVDIFGDRLIMQMPDDARLYPEDGREGRFAYLMQFKDGNRIDLTLQTILPVPFDSLSKVLLDKDEIIPELPQPSELDYYVTKPSESYMAANCNEFWWVCTYVAKGLRRQQLPYAKSMMEGPVRNSLVRLLSWKAAAAYDFKLNLGAEAKYLERYLPEHVWNKYVQTYAGSDYEEIWNSLLIMGEQAIELTEELNDRFDYQVSTEQKVFEYIKNMKEETQA